MLDVTKKIISVLINDSTLATLMGVTVPNTLVFTGPIDVVTEKQSEILMPQIDVWFVSESIRSVPQGARDTTMQLDIWSRKSQLEIENIYEQVLTLLDFISGDQGSSHLFWERLGSADDQYESDVRIFHRVARFSVWAI